MAGSVVLLSGGLDSATTLALALRDHPPAHALTVRYGQRHELEIRRAAEIARALGAASHRVVAIDSGFFLGSALSDPSVAVPKGRSLEGIGRGVPSTYVPARNTVLLSLALAWAESLGVDRVCLGVNALDYSGYPDCRPEFLSAFERLARLATRAGSEGRAIRVEAPLLEMGKGEIVRLAVGLGVPVGRTLSCYDPAEGGRPCGGCDACALRARGFAEAGVEDPSIQ